MMLPPVLVDLRRFVAASLVVSIPVLDGCIATRPTNDASAILRQLAVGGAITHVQAEKLIREFGEQQMAGALAVVDTVRSRNLVPSGHLDHALASFGPLTYIVSIYDHLVGAGLLTREQADGLSRGSAVQRPLEAHGPSKQASSKQRYSPLKVSILVLIVGAVGAYFLVGSLRGCGGGSEKSADQIRDKNYAKYYGDPDDPNTLAGKAKSRREETEQREAQQLEVAALAELDQQGVLLGKSVGARLACKSLWFICSGTFPDSPDGLRGCEQDPSDWDATSDHRRQRSQLAQRTSYWQRAHCDRFVQVFETKDRDRILQAQAREEARKQREMAAELATGSESSARLPRGTAEECERHANAYDDRCKADCATSGARIPGCGVGTDCYQSCLSVCRTFAGVELRTCNGE